MMQVLLQWDESLFLFLNGKHQPWLDAWMVFITERATWVPLYVAFLVLLIRQHRKKALWMAVFVIAAVSLSDQLSVHAFKDVFERLRPCHTPHLQDQVHVLTGCGGRYGFVSSHAANVFTLAGLMAGFLGARWKKIPYFLFPWAALVSYSRIYVGKHFPLDIIGGALVGLAVAFLVLRLYHAFSRKYYTS